MPTYVQDLDYSIHTIKRVTHQLKVIEDIDIANNRSLLTISVVRTNSGEEVDVEREAIKIVVNGETIEDDYDPTVATLPANGTDEVFKEKHYVSHNDSGGGTFTVSVTYKTDGVSTLGIKTYWTIGTAEITKPLTPIDMSKPTCNNIVQTRNRYGTDVSISFNASHKSYPLTSVQFTLNGLTYEQAYYRYGKETQADTSDYVHVYGNSYKLVLTKTSKLSNSNDINFDLDDYKNGQYPLDSGHVYDFEIIVTALNGISNKYTGFLNIPQKVTGITCESEIDLLPEQTTELVYNVIPQNAEEKTVEFRSSDNTVATVDSNGKITAIGEGMCQITVTTIDGGSLNATSGFSASCSVTVLNKNQFPKLGIIRYLSVREITNIVFACTFLSDKLTEKGLSVPELAEVVYKGRAHPVKEIRELLETVNSNCLVLKNASSSVYPTESLANQTEIIKQNTESNWYITVNEWIRFLNELNNLIEKEA